MKSAIGVFGDNLKKLRMSRELSQRGLARLAKITASQVCGFESGKSSPNLATLKKISKALKVSLVELIGD